MKNKNTDKPPRTLVFSFDGTGNEPGDAHEFKEDESISNILKLHILMGGSIQEDQSDTKTPAGADQKTYYYNGIGTREAGRQIPLLGQLYSSARKIVNMCLAPTFGDARRILDEVAKDFDDAKCNPDDRIVIFGFSRGAALARKFASLILAKRQDCRVSFLGVFDTVAAMNGIHRKGEKISSDVVFENGTLNGGIERAVHIVSLDEDRVPFAPTLINKDAGDPNRILEVWFPGVHSDVGGGYWLDGLSDIALAFMIRECVKALGDDIWIGKGDANGIKDLFAQQKDGLEGLEIDDVAIHPLNGMIHLHSGLLTGSQEPRLVCVNDNDRPCADLPILHHSVKERFQKVINYRPAALRGLEFRLLLDDGRISGEICGISGLREFGFPFINERYG
ncbi:MAG: DUF2235 domain-containing protein [Gammaproteobacteria bacterium]|nr:DUF2235 domain-containing protein [Gammaproteobacteria bacterium]